MSQQRLITQCPHCDTLFRVTAEQLDSAGGKVRCSRCRRVFNARGYLKENASRGPTANARAPQPAEPPRSTGEADVDLQLESAIRSATQVDLELAGEPATTRDDAGASQHGETELGFDLEGLDDDDLLADFAIQDVESDEAPTPSASAEIEFDSEQDAAAVLPDETTPDFDLAALDDADTAYVSASEPAGDEIDLSTAISDEEEITLQGEPWSDEASATGETHTVAEDSATAWYDNLEPPLSDAGPAETSEATESADDTPARGADHPMQTSYEVALEANPPDAAQNLFSQWGRGDEPLPYAPPVPEDEVPFAAAPPPPTAAPEEPPRARAEDDAAEEETDDDAAVIAAIASVAAETAPSPRYGNALVEELEATLSERKRRLPTLLYGMGSMLLLVLLAAQAGSAFRGELARYPALAPLTTLFCTGDDCAIPERRAPERIRIINRDVRPHPREPGALLISLTFVNEAPFAQPYPALEISFSDTHGQLIALRRFQPSEYLSGEQRSSDPLPPGERAAVSLSIVDPGERGISYRFEFY